MSDVRLETGAKAPAFTLPNQDSKAVTLASLAGKKAIVYFYPAAATPGCTKEACDFEESLNVFTAAGYSVVGISPDKPAKLAKFVKDQGLHFDLLSDEDLTVHKAYGAYGLKKLYGREYEGVLRSTFVLDEKGVVTLPLYNVKATGHVTMLRKQLGL
jgi:thioredoxin-dependent peroxiredoxin